MPAQHWQFTTIDYPGGYPPGHGNSWSSKINDAGVIVGHTQWTIGRGDNRAYVDDHGSFRVIQSPTGGATFGNDINNHGQVVGYNMGVGGIHGFRAGPGGYHQIDVPGTNATRVNGNNDHGQFVGTYGTRAATRGFLESNNHFTDVAVPGGGATTPEDINNHAISWDYSLMQREVMGLWRRMVILVRSISLALQTILPVLLRPLGSMTAETLWGHSPMLRPVMNTASWT